jgi:pantothenate synthetase
MMFVHAEVTYGFNLPQDYNELMQFEANEDLRKYRKTEDTIATRYTTTVNVAYPYKPKERSK